MERLKTRQRLEKLNTLGSPAPLANPEINYDAPEDDNSSHLASKIRVNSIINQSIPDMSYPPKKFKTQVTAKEIEEYQQKENTPIQIDGQFYRIHPASIPEPELEEVASDALVQSMYDKRSEKAVEINDLLVTMKQLRNRLNDVDDALLRLDDEFNEVMNKPPPKINFELANLLDPDVSISQFMNLNKSQQQYDRQRREDEEQ